MRLLKTKTALILTISSLSLLIAGSWHTKTTQYTEPRSPQISLSGNHTPISGTDFHPLKQAKKESVVRFSGDENKQAFMRANNLTTSDLRQIVELPNTYTITRPPESLIAAGALLTDQKQYVALTSPNDPIYPQWYTDKISAPSAWDLSTGSTGLLVADIDTGFALSHEDLAGRWASGGRDFVNNDNDPSTGITNPNGAGVSHGTATAGLIGATGNNAKGIASLNWGIKILPLQVLDDDGEGTTTEVASAIHYAVDQGAKVINMSLGSGAADPILKAELDYARDHDVVVVAAAGNCGSPNSYFLNGCGVVGQMVYPANYPQVLAVGATDSNDVRASFSSYGPNLDVVAPGSGSIRTTGWMSTNQTSAYTTSINGTSFSSPIVAALAALYRAYKPSASANDTISSITATTDKLGNMAGQNFTSEYGFGRINAAHALTDTVTSPVTPQPTPAPPETNATPLPDPTIPVAHPDGTLIRSAGQPEVYLTIDGVRYHIPDIDTFNSHDYSWSSVKNANDKDKELPISNAKLAFRGGSLVRGNSTPGVYSLRCTTSSCVKDHIASIDVFLGLSLNFGEVFVISQDKADTIPLAAEINSATVHLQDSLVLDKPSGKVYLIDNGTKRWVPSLEIFAANRYSWARVKTAIDGDLSLPDGGNVTFPEGVLLRANNDPAVYAINQISPGAFEKRHISSAATFAELGYKQSDIFVVDSSYLPSATGQDIGV